MLRGLSSLVAGSRRLAIRAEELQATRTVQVVIRRELGRAWISDDWTLTSDRTLALRAYRGTGYPCGRVEPVDPAAPAGSPPFRYDLQVDFKGSRRPDPRKDSVAVLLQNGDILPADLVQVGSAGCPGVEGLMVGFTTPRPLGVPPAAVRVFERIEYVLADSTLRLRRGRAGRQPLTAGRFGRATHFRPLGAFGLEAHLDFRALPGGERTGRPAVLRFPGPSPRPAQPPATGGGR